MLAVPDSDAEERRFRHIPNQPTLDPSLRPLHHRAAYHDLGIREDQPKISSRIVRSALEFPRRPCFGAAAKVAKSLGHLGTSQLVVRSAVLSCDPCRNLQPKRRNGAHTDSGECVV